MEVYRITHKKWSKKLTASGFPARWNSGGIFIIYTAGTRALACLENVVHKGYADFLVPFIIMNILIPDHLKILEISVDDLPVNWSKSGDSGYSKCQPFGDTWILKSDSAILKVPSAIVPGESNYLLNPNHPDFYKISIIVEEPFNFDDRLKNKK
jgi:RES domain-containing protein